MLKSGVGYSINEDNLVMGMETAKSALKEI